MSGENGTGTDGTVRVFLLDDHGLLRRGLRDLLATEDDIEVVGEASTVAEAKAIAARLEPDVALLDLRLPDGSGVDVCRHLREVAPDVAVVMLTSFDDEEEVVSAIMAGASGYLLKDVNADELLRSVRAVAAGHSILDPSVTARVLDRMRRGPVGDPELERLTDSERKVLALVAEGLTNRQIATRTHLSEKTVKNYVSDVLAKLNLTSRTQAAVFAVEHHLGPKH